jgi:hypothetical protein
MTNGEYRNSIDDFLDAGETVTISCQNPACGHSGKLDLQRLRKRLGGDHSMLLAAFRHVLRCSKCGGGDFAMIRHPNTKREPNPYIRPKSG